MLEYNEKTHLIHASWAQDNELPICIHGTYLPILSCSFFNDERDDDDNDLGKWVTTKYYEIM